MHYAITPINTPEDSIFPTVRRFLGESGMNSHPKYLGELVVFFLAPTEGIVLVCETDPKRVGKRETDLYHVNDFAHWGHCSITINSLEKVSND